MANTTGAETNCGGRFGGWAPAVMTYVWVDVAPPVSVARSTTVCGPTWSAVGVQLTSPVVGFTPSPVGPDNTAQATAKPAVSVARAW